MSTESTYSTHDPIFVLGFEYDLEKAHSAAKGILLKQNPGQAYLTIEELQQMAANNKLTKVSCYRGNISESHS